MKEREVIPPCLALSPPPCYVPTPPHTGWCYTHWSVPGGLHRTAQQSAHLERSGWAEGRRAERGGEGTGVGIEEGRGSEGREEGGEGRVHS